MSDETLLSLDDVATRLGKSREWVYRRCLANWPHRKIGNARKLTESDYAEWLDRFSTADPWKRSPQSRARRRSA